MFLNKLKLEVFKLLSKNPSYQHDVEYSVRKYKNTYKLLEEYDKKSIKDPSILADSGRLRVYIRDFQKGVGIRRTDSSV
ncbi:MAG: hypothetical protein A3D24_01460 [Candidatus Blackburnbacteria bacterium RIFCSPHIGHO2_02_FULL_39_13]|uniref:Uncharacterized protein n=1 Tax=Candidatus Blackburnbacteria bacterium RIFCSPLOWO2_01_FULL_40_20 TaxID=1797519 RepID=A0A1G1VFE6_9BACT|nr:MAG: hypothetical protein UT38_C0006G0035 [Microgenomates group bacterium GW2011_GWA2_39_19]OGY06796.1 MAG: hypothetical protein A2694_00565 [Candidatus Blackburnbacteria bacterium RIFCSPHIGHO2_01_FULL_40_17]OGY09811.1 MAG: hypothetical protein A3D24_01460 [Candidatus Blackburnbacteria bacterium RIFCSPHIGHO2_02_FULL_39_13]OGY14091.1 MAG: hypothetical protein A3A77_03905 [Candidatus Blackburnbacteria bacterium RIFCSPLOWO2_01_FULL_40_20]HBL52296.1 hypothetical protein [Candidatus Blackburnbact